MVDPKYPLGKLTEDPDIPVEKLRPWIQETAVAPGALHQRRAPLPRSMPAGDFARTFRRPDSQMVTLGRALGMNA